MKQLKRRFRSKRAEFKHACYKVMTDNNAVAILIIETFTAWKHKQHILNIWGMLGNPSYEAFREDYHKQLIGKYLSGRTDIWRSFYFAGYPDLYQYKTEIPEKFAMGDALAVAYATLAQHANK